MSTDTDRPASLLAAITTIEKEHGKGSVMFLDAEGDPVPVTSTGSRGLDLALGCGGYPRGRIIEMTGPEGAGKTTLALHAVAAMQAAGDTAALLDTEHRFDPSYAQALGVRLDKLLISQPDNGEQALDILDALVRSGAVGLLVVDSVASLVPRDDLEGVADVVSLQARMMSKAMRRLTTAVVRSNTTVLFLNPTRQRVGVTFGPSETTSGGNALKFYASVRLDVRRIGTVEKDGVVIGARTRVRVIKNKLAPPFRQAEFNLLFGRGIDTAGEDRELDESKPDLHPAPPEE